MLNPAEHPDGTNEQRLIALVAKGDQHAFAQLYDRLSGPLYSIASRMLGDTAEAEDALQDACLQIWRRAASYEPTKSSVFSWAVLITRSKVIDRLRAQGRRSRVITTAVDKEEPISASSASATQSAADIVEQDDEARRVQLILNELPPEQRQVIELAFFSELTHHEIAEKLLQPLGTIKARIRRGLIRLRDMLEIPRTP